MLGSKDQIVVDATDPDTVHKHDNDPRARQSDETKEFRWLSRGKFTGAILLNFCSFLLPAVYATLSKLWVANIDSSMIATVDSYTYIGVVAEVINEGLPRAAWTIIGDKSSRTLTARLGLAQTLIVFQASLGLLVSLILVGAVRSFTSSFVPNTAQATSLIYVRFSAFSAFSGAIEYAVANASRALDQPDVPLLISITRFAINIILDLLLISRFHVGSFVPSVNTQAAIRLACDMCAALAGLVYFYIISRRLQTKVAASISVATSTSTSTSTATSGSLEGGTQTPRARSVPLPSFSAFLVLLRPGLFTFTESAIRNTLYLWLVSNIVSMGNTYATAWSIFVTLRWGLIMVPVQTLEATSLTFVGHRWGEWRKTVDQSAHTHEGDDDYNNDRSSRENNSDSLHSDSLSRRHHAQIENSSKRKTRASWQSIKYITQPVVYASLIALLVEIPLCLSLSLTNGTERFARYISSSSSSSSSTIPKITAHMFRTIDWCYILYALSTQLATILLATQPKYYLYQSLTSNILYVLPWAIVCQTANLDAGNAWLYHGLVFGGSLVVSFLVICGFVVWWVWGMKKGWLRLDRVRY